VRQGALREIVTRAEKNRRELRTAIFFLLALEVPVIVMLIIGVAIDNDSLKVASYAMGMPVTFVLLSLVGLYFSWSDKP
jgi:NADH:ubiquinone oxidoreductase subunit 3 (subunit A)